MENKKTKAINDSSRHVSKVVHPFYFVKLSPTNPESISKIKKEEKVVKKMNQDICEITEMITNKVSKRNYLDSVLNRLRFPQYNRRYCMENRQNVLRGLYMALDELNFRSMKEANGGCLGEKFDKNSLNYLKLHGSKSLAEEKQILRDIKIQHKEKDLASFKSLEVLKETFLREWKKSETRIRYGVKEHETINGELYSLNAKLIEMHKNKDEAYQRIFKLKKIVSW